MIITLAVTILWHEYRQWQQDRIERRRLASVLLAEALNQAAFVVHLGTIINYVTKQKTWTTQEDLARHLPPPALVYSAMVGRLPVLGAVLSGNIVAFYDSIERARGFIALLPKDLATDAMAHVRFEEVALAAQFAADVGQSIITRLKKLTEPETAKRYHHVVEEVSARLRAVREGETPNVAEHPA